MYKRQVVNHKTPLAPSFTFLKNLIDYGDKIGSDPGLRNIFMNEIEATSAMIRRAYDAGVPLLCGSESGFSVTPYGEWHYREMGIYVEHLGLSPLQAIACGTEAGAAIFGLEGKLGRIEAGYIADLVLVAGDLVQDLDLMGQRSNIKAVFKGGKKIDLSRPLPENWSIPGWRTGQFSGENLTYGLANE